MANSGGASADNAGFDQSLIDDVLAHTETLVLRFEADGRIVEINPAAQRILGMAHDEIVGRSIVDFVHPDDAPTLRQTALNWKHNTPRQDTCELRLIAHDGTIMLYRWHCHLQYSDCGLSTIGAVGVRNEGPALVGEAYHSFVDKTLQGLIIIQDGQIVFVNRAMSEMIGFDVDRLQSMTLDDLVGRVHPHDRDKVTTGIMRAKDGLSSDHVIQFRAARHDGSERWIEIRPQNVEYRDRAAVQAMVLDITEQRHIQEAQRKSEEKYRLLIQNSLDAIFVIQDARFQLVNPVVKTLTGYSTRELIGMGIVDLIYEEDREEAVDRYVRRLRGEDIPSINIFRFVTKSGEIRWVRTNAVVIVWEGEPATLNFASDLTDWKRAEIKLRESEERYRAIVTHAPVGIMQYDRQGLIKACNQKFVDMLGVPTPEAMHDFDMLHTVADPQMLEAVRGALQGKVTYYDGDYRSASAGKVTPMRVIFSCIYDNDGEISGGMCFADDVTGRKRVEQELHQSREMYRALAENSPDIIMRFDREHRHVYVNSAVYRVTGTKPEDYIGRTHEDMGFAPELVSLWTHALDTVFLNGEPHNVEFTLDTPKGSIIFDWLLVPEFSADGQVNTVLTTSHNVTEIKRLEEFASRAQRLETAGRIAGQVAHDFNNLLGPLAAYPGLIRDELPPEHVAREYLDEMENAATQIAEINQQLLTLGRRGHYNQAPLNLNKLIHQAVRQDGLLTPTVSVELDLSESLMSIMGGSAQLYRVVVNLLANARDAVNGKGTLSIRTENYYVDDATGNPGQVSQGEYVKLTVSDDGVGMTADVQAKIFDPFFSTKTSDRRRGSGLGLSVVHAVVEDHNGYVDCFSEPNRGTSIYVYLPITREDTPPVQPEQISGGTESILIVDDDRIQRDVTQRLLEKLGYRVSSVDCGEKAIQVLSQTPQDLLVLDMIMPGTIDGAETLKAALEVRPDQRAIIVSGYAESSRVALALQLGASSFIRKPLTLKSIARAVRHALDDADVRT